MDFKESQFDAVFTEKNSGCPHTLAREVRALQDARTHWPNAQAQLIVPNPPSATVSWPAEIELIQASAWLLSDLNPVASP